MSILDLFSLNGRVAIVTGASSGLGAEFAVALAEAGADLSLGARRFDRLEETKNRVLSLGKRAISVAMDVAIPEECSRLVDATMEEFGRVDILVNNAGIGTAYPATRETPEQFRQVIDINLNGAYWMAQACGRVMKHGSSIVNISKRSRPDDRGATAGSVFGKQRRLARTHPRPGSAVDWSKRDPRQCLGPRVLSDRHDGPIR